MVIRQIIQLVYGFHLLENNVKTTFPLISQNGCIRQIRIENFVIMQLKRNKKN
jgi:hypothetical protein